MDRFLMHIIIDYPDDASELKIIRLNRAEASQSKKDAPKEKTDKLSPEIIFGARKEIDAVTISEGMEKYIVDIISATRYPDKYSQQLDDWLDFGGSPRASIAIDKACRTHAWMEGRDHVTPDDIRAVAHDCLRHRLMLSYEANASGISKNKVIDEILKVVAVVG